MGGPNVVAAMTAGALGNVCVTPGVSFAVNPGPVLCKLIDGKRRIIVSHEPGITVTTRAGGSNVERVDR